MSDEVSVGVIVFGGSLLAGLLRLVWLASQSNATLHSIERTLNETIVQNRAEHKEFYERLDHTEGRLTRVEDQIRYHGHPGGS
jgi:hypothetical protein